MLLLATNRVRTIFPCSPMSTPTRKNMPFNGRSILLRAFIHAPKLRRKSLILGEESGVRPFARDLHRCPQASSLRALASDPQSRTGSGDDLFRAVNCLIAASRTGHHCDSGNTMSEASRTGRVRVPPTFQARPGATCAPLANVVPPHFRSESSGKGVGVPTSPTPL